MTRLFTPLRVGLLVLLSGGLLLIAFLQVRKGGLSDRESIDVHAFFEDATGLSPKSRVHIAGIQVGEIQAIELAGNRAKVKLRIRDSVGLKQDAAIRKRSESLLGDYGLELFPGSDAAAPMPEGGEITRVLDQPGMEAVFESLGAITGDIREVTRSLREVLGGERGEGSMREIVENMVELSRNVDASVRASSDKLDRILENFERVSHDLRGFTQGQEQTVRDIVENISVITRDTREVLGTVKQIVGSNEGDLKDSVASLKQTLARLDQSLQNVQAVTEQVREGKGALGALVADERLGQRITETVDDVSDYASRLTRLQTEVSIRSEYLMAQEQAKNFLAVRLIPKPDKYYLVEIVDDPRGVVDTRFIQNDPPASGDPSYQRQTVTSDALKISAQFAKRFSFSTLRFGLIESTGGFGADFSFPVKYAWVSSWVQDALSVKVDVFDFSNEFTAFPRLRTTFRWIPYEHIYVNAGIDDWLNPRLRDPSGTRLIAGRDYFVGGGVYFTDADLKALLSAVPTPAL